ASHDLTLEVLTPVGSDYELMSDAKCIGRSAEGAGRAIIKLANEGRVDLELRTYLQIEKYIGPKNDLATPALKRILMDRKDENRQRRSRLLIQLAAMMTNGKVYALGQQPSIKAQAPSTLADDLLNYLVTNTYSKLGYIKVRAADPLAEIRAVLTADSVAQSKIAEATTEEGNALALAEMRQYLALAATQNRVLLSDVVDRFAKAPWGWRPAWETVLLVARLFMAGEIKLVMESNDLDGPGAVEPLTKEARFRNVSILKRKTNDNATRQKAREIHRDLFALKGMPPDEQDALVATFRENLRTLKDDLDRARVKAEQKHYPGGADVAKALTTINQQLAIKDSYEFIEAVVAQRNDWLDLADDTHDVLSFYKTQVPTWVRLLDTLNAVSDNHDALVKDPQAAAALAKLEAIRANPAPYGQVNQIDPLVTTLEKANEALAAERRERALKSLDAKLAEASHALDAAQASPELRNQVLKPLQDLKAQLAGLSSIPRILWLQGRSGELLDEVMDKLAHAAHAAQQKAPPPAPPQPHTGTASPAASPAPVPPPAPAAKPIQVVRVADMGSKTYLESEADVEGFVAQLKAELLATVRAGKKARVQ
ncbi:MAG: BREX system P-loop protein BrxC, partial [Acidovorax sp.]|nr:BREX system P-loop protein BrxC [Acidovorax sp.]